MSNTDFNLPTVVTSAGLQPQTPQQLLAALLALVSAQAPGYTADLPASLIEDISSTDVGALSLIDSARVEAVNSLTPLGANMFTLTKLGQLYIGQGTAPAAPTNTAVDVVFTGTVGFVIAAGFTVSDGSFQYFVQDGGIIGSSGQSTPIACIASTPGTWAVPSNTVNEVITSVPTGITLTVTNPLAGTPGSAQETAESFLTRVMQAGQAIGQGFPNFLRTLLNQVTGVNPNLVSIRQTPTTPPLWEIIVGGSGDPYQIAYAIYSALFDINMLTGSTLQVTNITNANPGVVTTNLNHGYSTGQSFEMSGIVGPTTLNGVPLTATVIDEKNFSIGVNTVSLPAYVSGGVVTPNLRNQLVSIIDYPDAYNIPFVIPPQQTVQLTLVYNTTEPNFVSQAAVVQAGQPALVNYINNMIPVGQPINLFEAQAVFQAAVSPVLPPQLLTRMVFTVSINGVTTAPLAGTGIIEGDPESYFFTTVAQVSISQG
jgi:Baseplate J-like protein/Ubiquitin-activating enzyme E1 FCCH domain